MWPFDKKQDFAKGLIDILNPTYDFMQKLHGLGGLSYVLIGSGAVLLVSIVLFTTKVVDALGDVAIPLSIALVVAGTALAIVWQILEYRVSVRKLDMVIDITTRMVQKKLDSQTTFDTSEMRTITEEVLKNVWGLEVKMLPRQEDSQ